MSYKKIGIIGFGSWVKNAYLPILSSIKDVTISHISAKTKESLDLAKNKNSDINIQDIITGNNTWQVS